MARVTPARAIGLYPWHPAPPVGSTPTMTVWSGGDWSGKGLPEEAAQALRQEVGTDLVEGGEPRGEILLGQPDPQKALALPNLKWIQITSAGITRYDTPEFRDALKAKGAILTNSSSVFDDPCAQHLLAFLLADARDLPEAFRTQLGPKDWPVERRRMHSYLLGDRRLLIVGYGAIARRLVGLLKPLGVDVTAVRRTPKGDEGVPTHPIESLDALLPEFDTIVNILPASPSTEGLFDADRFAKMKDGALFLNIGRGTTVDQDASSPPSRVSKAPTSTSPTPSRSLPTAPSGPPPTWWSPPTRRAAIRARSFASCATSSPTSNASARANRWKTGSCSPRVPRVPGDARAPVTRARDAPENTGCGRTNPRPAPVAPADLPPPATSARRQAVR